MARQEGVRRPICPVCRLPLAGARGSSRRDDEAAALADWADEAALDELLRELADETEAALGALIAEVNARDLDELLAEINARDAPERPVAGCGRPGLALTPPAQPNPADARLWGPDGGAP